jgi:hypothetical protein
MQIRASKLAETKSISYRRIRLPDEIVLHIAVLTVGAHVVADEALEFRTVGTAGVLVLAENSSLVSNLDIAPLTVKVQPVDGVARVVCGELGCRVVIAVRIVVACRIPQRAVAGVVDNKAIWQIVPGDGVVVLTKRLVNTTEPKDILNGSENGPWDGIVGVGSPARVCNWTFIDLEGRVVGEGLATGVLAVPQSLWLTVVESDHVVLPIPTN